ncbi:MAG TPA: beta-hydroxyacyl-ACP dehydratase, partial [Verrucomicrobiae bacterium]|nr:beta-hydroxyacyl-ACP dehydratase [Verrucomicrobiae bacterium]
MNDALVQSLKLLPHGPGFRFIDKLSALEPGRSATGEYLVKGDESFLSGHFPGQPLFPGVLLVEAGAQLGGIAAQSDPAVAPMANVRLTELRSIKI